MKILFLSRWFPFPPDNGSKIRIHNLLQGLSQRHAVSLLSFCDQPLPTQELLEQQKICSEIHIVPWKPFDRRSPKARVGLLSPIPASLVDTHSPQMESLIRLTLEKNKFDLIIASQITMASYYSSFQGIPAIFEELELGLFYEQSFTETHPLKRIRGQLSWIKLQMYLDHLLKAFTSITVVSEKERYLLASHLQSHSDKIKVLPNSINLQEYTNIPVIRKPCHIIFSGSFTYGPNYSAIVWFINHVFPRVLKQIPEAQLVITGDHAGLPLPSDKNITLAGYVDDIKSLIGSCDASIVPLWSGGGTRLKILEAMAIGTPVVATTKGAEGLTVENGKHILIADEPAHFAECVIRLLCQDDLRELLSSNAKKLMQEVYDWQVVMPRFLGLVEKTAQG
jgi:glycosyltransferase involved in cell wall biosynthesis